jgi:segregation and condensation protein A
MNDSTIDNNQPDEAHNTPPDAEEQTVESNVDEDEAVEAATLVEEQEENGLRSESIFNVDVPIYEGPMDLLLFVVRQRQVDLIELPLALIAQDFLEYARTTDSLDLDSAGEVLLVAAILVRMKVRALLPREEEEEVEDPEAVAARDEELEEAYREIVAAARKLAENEQEQRDYFPRGSAAGMVELDKTEELFKKVTVVNLAEAFRDLQSRMEKTPVHQLAMFTLTVDDMSRLVLKRLRESSRISFAEIAEHLTERIEVVVAFLAILELIRYQRVQITQERLFGEIWVLPGRRFDAEENDELRDDYTSDPTLLDEKAE